MTLSGFRILSAITVILVIGAVGLVMARLTSSPELEGKRLFPDLAAQAEQVSSLSILSAGESLTFNRTASGWSLAERNDYPADGEKLWQTFFGLSELRLVEPKTADPARYQKLDLGDPASADSQAREIRVQDHTGADLAALIVGRRKQAITVLGEGGVYVRRPDEQQSWLASGALAVGHDAAFWLDPLILSIPVTRIHRLSIRQHDGALLEMIRDTPEDRLFELVDLDPSREARPDGLERLGAAFDGLLLDDVRPVSKGDDVGDQAVVATLQTFDGLRVTARSVIRASDDQQDGNPGDHPDTIQMGEQKEPIWAQFNAEAITSEPLAVEEATQLQERLDGWIFRLNPFQADNLRMTRARATQPAGTQAETIMQRETLGLDGEHNDPGYPFPGVP